VPVVPAVRAHDRGSLDSIVFDGTDWILWGQDGSPSGARRAILIDPSGTVRSEAYPANNHTPLLGAGPERWIATMPTAEGASIVEWNMRLNRPELSIAAFPAPVPGRAAARIPGGRTVAVVGSFPARGTMVGSAPFEVWLALVRDGTLASAGRVISPP
jgi:hypothetical protein